MALSRDLKEFLQLLAAHEVRFMLVGAHAVAIHGFPRNTMDIDFWVERSRSNGERILAALDDFGFGGLGLRLEDLTEGEHVIQLGREPNRIDLLTFLTGVDFEDCWERRLETAFEGQRLPVIGLDDLLQNKRMTGRLKDLADVEEFERRRK
jgi:hypothetical protein